jgi:hypothetical protein
LGPRHSLFPSFLTICFLFYNICSTAAVSLSFHTAAFHVMEFPPPSRSAHCSQSTHERFLCEFRSCSESEYSKIFSVDIRFGSPSTHTFYRLDLKPRLHAPAEISLDAQTGCSSGAQSPVPRETASSACDRISGRRWFHN